MQTLDAKGSTVSFKPSDPLWVILSAAALSSLGGIAVKLRSNEDVTARQYLAAGLHSLIIGLIVCLACYNFFETRESLPLLLAVSGLAGIGGANVVDVICLFLLGKVKVKISMDVNKEVNDDKSSGVH